MRAFNANIAASRYRIKKMYKKSLWTSRLYVLGALVLAVMAFFPAVNIYYSSDVGISIVNFYKAVVDIFKSKLDVANLIVMVLYLAMLVVTVICLFKCMASSSHIARRNPENITTCNKNAVLMEEAAAAFSVSFFVYVLANLIIFVISYSQKSTASLTIWAFIALGVASLVHIFAGMRTGTISIFIVNSTIEEKQRPDKIGLFVMRNVMQLIVTAAFLYFFVPATTVYIHLGKLFAGETSAFTNIGGDFMGFIAVILQVVTIVFVCILIKHATGMTEFSLTGMDTHGIYNFRIFAIIVAALSAGLFVVDKMGDEMIMSYLFAAVVAAIGAVLDFIFHEKVEKETDNDDLTLRQMQALPAPQQQPQPQQPAQMPNGRCVQSPQACCGVYMRPCVPADMVMVGQANQAQQEKDGDIDGDTNINLTYINRNSGNGVFGLPEGLPPTDKAPTVREVKCPSCEKWLSIKDSVQYHRCPACGKVFTVRTGKKVPAQQPAPAQE